MLKRLFVLAILLIGLVAGLHYLKLLPEGFLIARLAPVSRRLGEAKLSGAVKAALRLHRLTKGASIDVSSEEGVVTLRGTTPSAEARDTAVRVAEAVPGVEQVVSHVKVVPAPPRPEGRSLGESLDDRTLEMEVRLALSLRRELAGSEINVHAYRRQVRLTGTVPDDAARHVAVRTVAETAGVARVTDETRLRAPGPRDSPDPGKARQAAERAVRDNPNLAKYALQVVEEGGALVLKGRVGTGAEKDLAGLLAREAAAGPVRNALQIHP